MRGSPWSDEEVAAIVDDYLSMLSAQLRGDSFNKAEHRKRLREKLPERSDASVEFKHQNISAILLEDRQPYVVGYKPLPNYQGILREAVVRAVDQRPDLKGLMESAADALPQVVPTPPSFSNLFVPAPHTPPERRTNRTNEPAGPRISVDYEERERRNRELGTLGEEFVVELERRRLKEKARPDLADRVEWAARERGDGLGYDVASWEVDPSGSERETHIEVKTTNQGIYYPFFLTASELEASERLSATYRLYRVFGFSRDPHLFVLSGSLRQHETRGAIAMRPRIYEVRPGVGM